MGKNQLRTALIKFNYEDELGVFIPDVNYRLLDREINDWYNTRWHRHRGRGHDNHKVEGIYPWDRARRTLVAFEGKPFAKAFSKYCEEGPVYQQHNFLESIDKFKDHFCGKYRNNTHYIDDNGLIQAYPDTEGGYFHYYKKTRHFIVTSIDYETELRHKVTGAKKSEFSGWNWHNTWHGRYPGMQEWQARKAHDAEFEEVCIAGWKKEFETNCDEYRRLFNDVAKQRRKRNREKEKENANKAYSFLTKAEQEQKKYDADNNRKIVRKGFDLITSFRNEKQTHLQYNPDLIKKAQGFALSNFDFWE